ncbi:aspartate dehydrogenase domain-containing protein [Lacrimispora brassicae]
MNKLRLGIIGNGYLGGIIAGAWKDGLLPEYELVGIVGRTKERSDALAAEMGCRSCAGIHELLELKPDYIAEAASVGSVKDMAEKILAKGSNLIVLSIGAFADKEFYEKVKETAKKHNTKVYIASGAVGGFDVLRTVSLMGESTAGIETRKGSKSLGNTPLFEEHLMTDKESSMVFEGNAKEAIGLLPTKVNVAVATSLATVGPEKTKVNIHSVPGMVGDDHKITAEIDGVKAVVDIYSSTSAIAGWSVVAVLQNIVSPVVF